MPQLTRGRWRISTQQLEARDTYTPTVIPHDRGNCDRTLKTLGGTGGASGLKTAPNNPDSALTLKGENMQIYVLNHKGRSLMPCSPRTARLLLKNNKARVVKRTPFTIQWTVPTRSFTQSVALGVDSGFVHVGLTAVSKQKELYAADVRLRTDIVKLNAERRAYRRTRRARKT